MTYDTYRYIFIIAGILCIVMVLISVILFFTLKIPDVIADLTGRKARKGIQDIREKNESGGDKTYLTSVANRSRGKLTDKISRSGKITPSEQTPLGTGVVTSKIATQNLAPVSNETTVLEQQSGTGLTGKLPAGETTVLSAQELENLSFEIEFEITYVHTNEIVRA